MPGLSDQDFVKGIVMGTCVLAGLPRYIIESESLTVHGQEEPCQRTFYAPIQCVVPEGTRFRPGEHGELHSVA